MNLARERTEGRLGPPCAAEARRYTYYRLRADTLAALAGHYAGLAERAERALQIRRPCS